MKNLFKTLSFLSFFLLLISCNKSEDSPTFTPRPYSEVYTENLSLIEDFLNHHYAIVDADYNVTFDTLLASDNVHVSVMNHPNMLTKTLQLHDVPGGYKVYYLKLNEGVGESPTKLDSSMVAYKGTFLKYQTKNVTVGGVTTTLTYMQKKQFDYAPNPVWFKLDEVVTGWGLVIPEFKTGNYAANPNGTVSFSDFGAGVMFLPSGLGYYSSGAGTIPGYAPLVFSFKLMKQRRRDHDRDKIESRYEFGDFSSRTGIDTDGDGAPDFFDTDDDNDGYLTMNEIKHTYTDTSTSPDTTYTFYYPYNGAAVDDASTPFVDESQGIPSCGGTDFTSPTRIRKHLDKNCH